MRADRGPIRQRQRHVIRVVPVREDQEEEHAEEVETGLPQRSAPGGIGRELRRLDALLVAAAEDRGHDQADEDREDDRSDEARHPEVETQHPGREEDRHHVDGGTGVQERARRAESGAHRVDPREHRQHAARADRQHHARDGCDAVGDRSLRVRPEVAQHGRRGQKGRDRARDEHGRHDTGQRVVHRVPLQESKRLQDRARHLLVAKRDVVSAHEDRREPRRLLPLLHDSTPALRGRGRRRPTSSRRRSL